MEMATEAATSILSADEVLDHTPEGYAKTNNKEVVSHDEEQVTSTLPYVKDVAPVKDPNHNSGIVPNVQPDNPSSVPTVPPPSKPTCSSTARRTL